MSAVLLQEEASQKKMATLPIINASEPGKKVLEKEEKWLREVKTYEFLNLEDPGVMLNFSYGGKQRMKFSFVHGGKYKLPRFLARHVESRCVPIWKYRPDGLGSMIKELIGYQPRFQMRELYE